MLSILPFSVGHVNRVNRVLYSHNSHTKITIQTIWRSFLQGVFFGVVGMTAYWVFEVNGSPIGSAAGIVGLGAMCIAAVVAINTFYFTQR